MQVGFADVQVVTDVPDLDGLLSVILNKADGLIQKVGFFARPAWVARKYVGFFEIIFQQAKQKLAKQQFKEQRTARLVAGTFPHPLQLHKQRFQYLGEMFVGAPSDCLFQQTVKFLLPVKGEYVKMNPIIIVGILHRSVDFVPDKRRDQRDSAFRKVMLGLTNSDQTLSSCYEDDFEIAHDSVITYVPGIAAGVCKTVDIK